MVKPNGWEETECEELEADPEYWEKLIEAMRKLPDAIEAEGEDPEPFV